MSDHRQYPNENGEFLTHRYAAFPLSIELAWPSGDEIHCHDGEKEYGWGPTRHFQRLEHAPNYDWCRYCGSMNPRELYSLLIGDHPALTGSAFVHLGGADWKGGPHKFYVYDAPGASMMKFKNEHLNDVFNASGETFEWMTKLLHHQTSIRFVMRYEGDRHVLSYYAPYHGYQR